MATHPSTCLAADLRQGEVFVNPNTGEHVAFQGWGEDEDGPFAIVTSATTKDVNLDPSTIVNLEES